MTTQEQIAEAIRFPKHVGNATFADVWEWADGLPARIEAAAEAMLNTAVRKCENCNLNRTEARDAFVAVLEVDDG